MTASSAPARRWLLVAVAALVAAWVAVPSAVPIYDGLGNPDEPYRYVKVPAGQQSRQQGPPTSAKRSLPVRNGRNASPAYVNTGESGPQLSLYVPAGAFAVTGSPHLAVQAVPLAPQPPLPTDGTVLTNVYRITTTPPARVVGSGATGLVLQMRSPTTKGSPVFEHKVGSHWVRAKTARVGFDIYQTQPAGLGEWLLAQPSGTTAATGGGVNVGLLAGGIALLVVVAVVVVIRRNRLRAA
jgi:hypothetical protein